MKTLEDVPKDQIDCIVACRKISNRFHDKQGWLDHNVFLECRLCQNHASVYLHFGDAAVLLHGHEDERPLKDDGETHVPWFTFLRWRLRDRIAEFSAISF